MIFSRCTEHTLYRVEMSRMLHYYFTSRCTHDIPHMHHHIHSRYRTSPMYLWYPPTCIMISPTCIMIFSLCTEHTLCMVEMSPIIRYCFTSDVLMIFPTCIIISTQCTEHHGCTYGIPNMHHDFPRCNEHTLYRVEMSPILHYCFTSRCTHDIPHMHHDIHSMY